MIGRDSVISEVSDKLRDERFVTLLGPGGIGRTTIALAVGRAAAEEFGGKSISRLGSLTDPRHVAGLSRHPWDLHSNRRSRLALSCLFRVSNPLELMLKIVDATSAIEETLGCGRLSLREIRNRYAVFNQDVWRNAGLFLTSCSEMSDAKPVGCLLRQRGDPPLAALVRGMGSDGFDPRRLCHRASDNALVIDRRLSSAAGFVHGAITGPKASPILPQKRTRWLPPASSGVRSPRSRKAHPPVACHSGRAGHSACHNPK
jgi:hypothetical protein